MKALAAVLILQTLLCSGQEQTPIKALSLKTSTNGIAALGLAYMTSRSNLVTISNAVKIASGLRAGMPNADVVKYMQDHDMSQTNMFSMSLDRGRTLSCFYALAGVSTSLVLEMECSQPPTLGLYGWKNPLLKGAYIQSQGANIIFITLTNAP
jgi:hypothetical protein